MNDQLLSWMWSNSVQIFFSFLAFKTGTWWKLFYDCSMTAVVYDRNNHSTWRDIIWKTGLEQDQVLPSNLDSITSQRWLFCLQRGNKTKRKCNEMQIFCTNTEATTELRVYDGSDDNDDRWTWLLNRELQLDQWLKIVPCDGWLLSDVFLSTLQSQDVVFQAWRGLYNGE